MSVSISAATRTRPRSRLKTRLMGAAGAVGAALVVWSFADLLGMEVLAPGFGGEPPSPVGPGSVVFAAAIASLAGWGLLALLERITQRARITWTVLAAVVFTASLGGPMSGDGVTAANRAVLVLLHVAVAAVLIPVLHRTAAGRGGESPG